jgi:hypothetical protein
LYQEVTVKAWIALLLLALGAGACAVPAGEDSRIDSPRSFSGKPGAEGNGGGGGGGGGGY